MSDDEEREYADMFLNLGWGATVYFHSNDVDLQKLNDFMIALRTEEFGTLDLGNVSIVTDGRGSTVHSGVVNVDIDDKELLGKLEILKEDVEKKWDELEERFTSICEDYRVNNWDKWHEYYIDPNYYSKEDKPSMSIVRKLLDNLEDFLSSEGAKRRNVSEFGVKFENPNYITIIIFNWKSKKTAKFKITEQGFGEFK